MHTEFKIGLDKTDSQNYPNFEPEEIDVFLNNAIERFVSQRAYGTNPKRLGLEETQKRMDDLRNLISDYRVAGTGVTTENKPNGQFFALPSDYRHAVQEEANLTYTDCDGNQVAKITSIIPITHDRYNNIIDDPFNKPDDDDVLRLSFGSSTSPRVELVTGPGSSVSEYRLRYLKQPAAVQYGTQYATPTTDVDCDLADHTHKEIVKSAVTEALGNIESPRIAVNKQELNEIE